MIRHTIVQSAKNWRENWQKTIAAKKLCLVLDPSFAQKPRYQVLKSVDDSDFELVHDSTESFEPSDGSKGGFSLTVGTFIERKIWIGNKIKFYEDQIMFFDGYTQTYTPYTHYIEFESEQDLILFKLQFEYA